MHPIILDACIIGCMLIQYSIQYILDQYVLYSMNTSTLMLTTVADMWQASLPYIARNKKKRKLKKQEV